MKGPYLTNPGRGKAVKIPIWSSKDSLAPFAKRHVRNLASELHKLIT